MSNTIAIEYEQVSQMSSHFSEESARVRKVLTDLERQIQVLKQGGWIGDAADAYYQEMDTDVIPGVNRLIEALTLAADTMSQLSTTMKNAEEEAQACFPKTTN
jgi:WXG100 family type VII secretion target